MLRSTKQYKIFYTYQRGDSRDIVKASSLDEAVLYAMRGAKNSGTCLVALLKEMPGLNNHYHGALDEKERFQFDFSDEVKFQTQTGMMFKNPWGYDKWKSLTDYAKSVELDVDLQNA